MTASHDPEPGPPRAHPPGHDSQPPSRFPARLAAVDVGSNAIRMRVAEFSAPGEYITVAIERGSVRLARGMSAAGLAPEVMDAAVAALAAMRRRMDELQVVRHRAVATSAVREAANGEAFLERVRREAGVDLEVISGRQEAAFVYRAVRERLPLGEGSWLLVDIGGGSTEVAAVSGGGVLWSHSHPVGAVRLLEELPPAEQEPESFRAELGERARPLTEPPGEPRRLTEMAAGMIGVGGNIEALARLAKRRPEDGPAVLSLAELRALIERLASLSYRERIERLGLREDRADVILPAALLYEHLAQEIGAATIHVPWVGVREGVLLELADTMARDSDRPPAPSAARPA